MTHLATGALHALATVLLVAGFVVVLAAILTILEGALEGGEPREPKS